MEPTGTATVAAEGGGDMGNHRSLCAPFARRRVGRPWEGAVLVASFLLYAEANGTEPDAAPAADARKKRKAYPLCGIPPDDAHAAAQTGPFSGDGSLCRRLRQPVAFSIPLHKMKATAHAVACCRLSLAEKSPGGAEAAPPFSAATARARPCAPLPRLWQRPAPAVPHGRCPPPQKRLPSTPLRIGLPPRLLCRRQPGSHGIWRRKANRPEGTGKGAPEGCGINRVVPGS